MRWLKTLRPMWVGTNTRRTEPPAKSNITHSMSKYSLVIGLLLLMATAALVVASLKKTLGKYRHFWALVAAVAITIGLIALGAPAPSCALLLGLWQLTQFAQSPAWRHGRLCAG